MAKVGGVSIPPDANIDLHISVEIPKPDKDGIAILTIVFGPFTDPFGSDTIQEGLLLRLGKLKED